jgi:C-terminal processing protease CtpA/Prc
MTAKLTRTDREQLLSKIEKLVQTKFYDPTFNGKNWNQIVAQHRTAILNAESNEAFEGNVSAMLAELNTSGLGLLSEDTAITPRNAINASFHAVDTAHDGERWVFQDVLPGGVAARAGIRSADALIKVQNKEILPPEKPAFLMDQRIPIVISRNGERKEAHLELRTPQPKYKDCPYAEPESIAASIGDSLGQIKVSLFPGKIGIDFANRMQAVVTQDLKAADRLIVDLRGNPGGGVGGVRLMSYFTAGTEPIGYSLDRKTAEHGYDKDKLPRFGRIPHHKWEIALLALKYGTKKTIVLQTEGLGKQKFHGKVVVLINEHSTGAAEMVTQFAQENRLAAIVGAKTPGHLVAREASKLGFGYRLTIPIAAYLSWSGNRIEGKGIQPDIPVDWSYESALHGVDNQLERAIEVASAL